jgi:polygalacturonase
MGRFNIRNHGARGDGVALDHGAINAAIAAAHKAGGGTVEVPSGRYLCFSVRLESNVRLHLAAGAVLVAADPAQHAGAYDPPEDNGPQLYQDFGHSHWHNSLIWGDGLEHIAITGPGRIEGRGLTRNGPGSRWKAQAGERPLSMAGMASHAIAALEPDHAAMVGLGNKAIALRGCRHVELSGFTVDGGGHFAILATGCADMRLASLTIDTERDGIDLDCVERVVVEDCRVNAPNDDAIVIKASYALGRRAPCQDVVVRRCHVSGYDRGTLLDGTLGRTLQAAPDGDPPTGRIKIGTETNGDIRRITIEACHFARSRGLAIESVDGAVVEDVVARAITMKEVTNAPLFLRLGARLRGPAGTTVGAMRRIVVDGLQAKGITSDLPVIIAGLAGHSVEDVRLANITLTYEGAPPHGVPADPPEVPNAYPEPSMFGLLPAWGLWLRHACKVTVQRWQATPAPGERRDPMVAQDVEQLNIAHME